MANLSDAEGTITFITNNETSLNAIVDVFHTADDFTYNTSFNINDIQVSTNHKGHTVATVPFYGSGRWSYDFNTEHMIAAISENLTVSENTLTTVTDSWFEVTIDWREYELGNCFVANGSVQYCKNAGEPFDHTVTTQFDTHSDDISVPAMRAYGFDAYLYTDFSREGISNFIDYFMKEDPDKIGDLNQYTIDQLAKAMKGHEHDVFCELEYLREYDEDIEDYRERILDRVRR